MTEKNDIPENSNKDKDRHVLTENNRKEIIELIKENSEIFQKDNLHNLSDETLIQIKQALFMELRKKKK